MNGADQMTMNSMGTASVGTVESLTFFESVITPI